MDVERVMPEQMLHEWIRQAREAGEPMPEAMALATTGSDGGPSVRMVMLRELVGGLVFCTDVESDKGLELEHHRRAAVLFHWLQPVQRQVRLSGPVARITEAEADRYWINRQPQARATAAASRQSRVITDPAQIEREAAELQRRHGDDIPRPERWGGYRLHPRVVEFWEEGADRLHARHRMRRTGEGWVSEQLAP